MRKPGSVLIICVLLAFGASLAVPAEDVPETAYDESESLPYEGTPLFSTTLSQPFAFKVPAPRANTSSLWSGSLREYGHRQLDRGTNLPHPVSDLLIILDHSFRC
jgi:hypothetical protein